MNGGKVGFDQQVWSARPLCSGVELTLTSPDGDQGFPGNLYVRVRYTISANALRIDYFCSTDQTTVVNLTNQTYFNLSGSSDTTILGDELTISADRFTPVNSALLPTGTLSSVEGTPFDFRSKAVIGARIGDRHKQLEIAGGYDHNFVLNGAAGELRPVALLYSPVSGRILRVFTTGPGLQFVTDISWITSDTEKRWRGMEDILDLASRHNTFPIPPIIRVFLRQNCDRVV